MLNKIRPLFYIAHTFNQRFFVRDELVPALQSLGIDVLNPFYKADGSYKESRPEVKLADDLEAKGTDAEQAVKFIEKVKVNHEDIVDTDLDLIFQADGIIAFMPSSSTGTTCEIWTCGGIFKWLKKRGFDLPDIFDKPTFLVTVNDRLWFHPWIKYACVEVFKSSESLLEYLKKNLPELRISVKEVRERKSEAR